MNKTKIKRNYSDAVYGADSADYQLLLAQNLLHAQFDELMDTEHDHRNFKHYQDELVSLNVVVSNIIDGQRDQLSKRIAPTRTSLADLLNSR